MENQSFKRKQLALTNRVKASFFLQMRIVI